MKIDGNRQDMGRVGAWVWDLVTAPAPHIREAVRAIEDMGYGAVWFPESRGREAIALSAILLAETSTIKVAPGIANIWARDASAAAGAAMALGEAWPERFMLGLGVSHASSVGARGHEYLRPLTRMEEYLNAMESAVFVGPRPDAPVPVGRAHVGVADQGHVLHVLDAHDAEHRAGLLPGPPLVIPVVSFYLVRGRGRPPEETVGKSQIIGHLELLLGIAAGARIGWSPILSHDHFTDKRPGVYATLTGHP